MQEGAMSFVIITRSIKLFLQLAELYKRNQMSL